MRRVLIADEDGSNVIALEGAEAPSPLPEPTGESKVELFFTRPSAGAPGRRLVSSLGYDPTSYEDIEFACRYVSAAKWTALKAKRDAWPPAPVRLTIEDGAADQTVCLAVFATQGLVPTRWTQNGDKLGVRFKFHKIEEV